jgi:hypothetical protein
MAAEATHPREARFFEIVEQCGALTLKHLQPKLPVRLRDVIMSWSHASSPQDSINNAIPMGDALHTA